jgi:hypothetical protein
MEQTANLYTLKDLLTMPLPKPKSLVDGLLFADETALFIARQKEGKSTLMLQLCLDVANGATFLGRYRCAKTKTLYVDYENRPYRIQERAKDLLESAAVPDVIFYALNSLSDRDIGLLKPEDFEKLEQLISEQKPGLVVIDPLRYAVNGELDEPNSMKVIEQVAELKQTNPSMAVVLVHHTRKSHGDGSAQSLKTNPRGWMDKVYGSQALLAHVETIWGLEKNDDSYTFATVPRSQSGLNLILRKESNSERFIFDSEAKKEFTDAQKVAWKLLPESFTWSEAKQFDIADSTLSRTLDTAKAAGLLFQDRESKLYRKLSNEALPPSSKTGSVEESR